MKILFLLHNANIISIFTYLITTEESLKRSTFFLEYSPYQYLPSTLAFKNKIVFIVKDWQQILL
jgi:hypothetical protein